MVLWEPQLVQLFCGVRDAWIAQDLAGWLAPNRIYPGVASAVQQALAHDEVYIVTTKQVGASGRCVARAGGVWGGGWT